MGNKLNWDSEYEDSLFKIYDSKHTLAGYFFPYFDDSLSDDQLLELVKSGSKINAGGLMVPMVKLDLLDREDGLSIELAARSLQESLNRLSTWKKWIDDNSQAFSVVNSTIYTAREDRNMLTVLFDLRIVVRLKEKEVIESLKPLLDALHNAGLL